jgi:hypothetical protein
MQRSSAVVTLTQTPPLPPLGGNKARLQVRDQRALAVKHHRIHTYRSHWHVHFIVCAMKLKEVLRYTPEQSRSRSNSP